MQKLCPTREYAVNVGNNSILYKNILISAVRMYVFQEKKSRISEIIFFRKGKGMF